MIMIASEVNEDLINEIAFAILDLNDEEVCEFDTLKDVIAKEFDK